MNVGRIDVKSTGGPFSRELHISLAELKEMTAGGGMYRIYRIYEIGDAGAKLRISSDLKPIAESILNTLKLLPKDVTVDAISMIPDLVSFGAEILFDITNEDEDL